MDSEFDHTILQKILLSGAENEENEEFKSVRYIDRKIKNLQEDCFMKRPKSLIHYLITYLEKEDLKIFLIEYAMQKLRKELSVIEKDNAKLEIEKKEKISNYVNF